MLTDLFVFPAEELDRAWSTDRSVFAVWALGSLDAAREPAFHRVWPRSDIQLVLAATPPENDCFDFVMYSHTHSHTFRSPLRRPVL